MINTIDFHDKEVLTSLDIATAVMTHLIAQGRPALKEDGSCAYRGLDGDKCAAGILIQDEEYIPEMEHHSLIKYDQGGWRIGKNIPLPARLQPHGELIRLLQGLHDNWSNIRRNAKGWDYKKLQNDKLERLAKEVPGIPDELFNRFAELVVS